MWPEYVHDGYCINARPHRQRCDCNQCQEIREQEQQEQQQANPYDNNL